MIRPDGEWREEMCLYWREKSLLLSVSFTLSPSFFFLITVYPVAWQADGSDYSVIINHGRKPWERRRDDRMRGGGESEILWGLTGQHTCRSCPRISACAYFHHLDGSDLHQTRGKVIKNYDSARKTFFFFFFLLPMRNLWYSSYWTRVSMQMLHTLRPDFERWNFL